MSAGAGSRVGLQAQGKQLTCPFRHRVPAQVQSGEGGIVQEEGVEGMASHRCAPAASARSGIVREIEVAERFGSATSIRLFLGPHPSVSRLVAYVCTFAHMWLVYVKLLA